MVMKVGKLKNPCLLTGSYSDKKETEHTQQKPPNLVLCLWREYVYWLKSTAPDTPSPLVQYIL